MDFHTVWQAILLGVVEGLTEFLPVSSTGHLIVVGDWLGIRFPGRVFEIAIQLGAVLAICVLYFKKLTGVAFTLHSKPESRHFALMILLAFLPAVVIGVLAHDIIKETLMNPLTVGIALIVGGIVIILVERSKLQIKYHQVEQITLGTALKIGFFQCIAMIPGVSRSGATILGALCMGVERRAAAEFSFFLAIPTMLGATVYDLYKNRHLLDGEAYGIIAVGFVTAFLTALLVVKVALAFISRYGFTPFAYYRIAFGCLILALVV
jgi:undecaprenyl-diphosphatase